MTPVRRRDLAVLVLGLTVAAWLLVRAWYGDLPPLRWWLPAPLAVLALGEALGARVLRTRLRALREARAGRGPAGRDAAGVRPVEPMLVARLAVLAQASAYVGAVFTGVWLGVLAYTGPAVDRLQAAGSDTVTALLGLLASLALIAAALWLESACRVPPGSTDDEPAPGVRA
ncbi:DUF3180 domain-containing protein [Blastococcus sp. VKM Ac-2987]|uniref:DUF3180 domain-containing protein n=1 Tax=Blastococcus sp. VKM Ac-2987 TaxID=3004141 RepID=UPI0022AB9F81|nr:DUF3180 domain-containing protein [Blastococcus sp. VKM Ac-2987]MCZ2858297.1 DUF3180 domain-containing protein [Blastococcus sp. VKM Ac-2987]